MTPLLIALIVSLAGVTALLCRIVWLSDTYAPPEPPDDGFHDDYRALCGDWQAVGDDLRAAMGLYEEGTDDEQH